MIKFLLQHEAGRGIQPNRFMNQRHEPNRPAEEHWTIDLAVIDLENSDNVKEYSGKYN